MANDVHVITMPKLGETVTEGTVSAWLKSVGDSVAFDDPLLEVSTDKVDSEIPSPYDGVLLEVLVDVGQTVPVGAELARIGPAGTILARSGVPAAPPTPATAETAAPVEVAPTLQSGSAAHVITMPKLGETVTEGTVSAWLKSVGDSVAFDDPLLEVSTDKVDSEIPSPYDGVLAEIAVPAGETVQVGTVLARIAPAGATLSPTTLGLTTTGPGTSAVATNSGRSSVPVLAGSAHGRVAGRPLSPVVRRLAAEHGLDLAAIEGTGGGGRIMREDVLAAVAAGAGSAAARAPMSAPPAPSTQTTPVAASDADEVVPLSRIRLITAERMLQSKQISPHVWTSVEVDLESIEQIRRKHKERFRKESGTSLTYLPFIARAACDALRAFPTVNSSVDIASKTMVLHRRVSLAIAVDLNEQGLMAPVIKDADSLNIRGMARAIRAVGDGAKNKTLTSDDMSGSTFTLTNPGPMGSFASAPIINQPNVAIMSTEGVARRAVVVGDAIAIHHTCVLGFSYDHRAFDGVTAARFLMFVRDALQDRDWEVELG